MAVQDYQAPDLDDLLECHRKWAQHFTEPKPLGIEKALAIVTCMDGRLMPASQVCCQCLPAIATHQIVDCSWGSLAAMHTAAIHFALIISFNMTVKTLW
jgi:hypothetical protein